MSIIMCCRCIKMALVHDMAESIVGDLTPHDDISVSQKHQHEQVCPSIGHIWLSVDK